MTSLEAFRKARSMWGRYADVRKSQGRFLVGHYGGLGYGLLFNCRGEGRSWEEAFSFVQNVDCASIERIGPIDRGNPHAI